MSPIIPDRADASQRPGGNVTPLTIPSRTELWRRLRLAQSLLSHRPACPATSALVIEVLDGHHAPGVVPPQREPSP